MALQKRPSSVFGRSANAAYVEFNGGYSTIDCVVHFSSEGGANLEFESVKNIPTRFLLHVDGRSPAKQCVVMWKIGTTLAVELE
jgi:hypothetical protein